MALPITIFKNLLNFKCMHIEKAEIETRAIKAYGDIWDQDIVVISARPFKRNQCICPICGNKCVKDGFKQECESSWSAPNLNGMPVFIRYRPQRILCPEHGALNEYIPWADGNSRFTAEFNDEVAWMVCQTSKAAICEFEGINRRTVGNCIKASHDRLEPDISLRIHDDVCLICVDETSYMKGYKYITVIYDMDRNHVIWVHENHGYDIFAEFCSLLTEDERQKLK